MTDSGLIFEMTFDGHKIRYYQDYIDRLSEGYVQYEPGRWTIFVDDAEVTDQAEAEVWRARLQITTIPIDPVITYLEPEDE